MDDLKQAAKPLNTKILEQISQKLESIENYAFTNVKQNEDILNIQTEKVDLLDGMDKRDERVMLMYKRKNLISSIFGILGLGLTGINVTLVAVGMMYLPEETKLLFNQLIAMVAS